MTWMRSCWVVRPWLEARQVSVAQEAGDTRHVWLLRQMASRHGGVRGEEGGGHVELGEAKQLGQPLPAFEGEPPRPRHYRVHHTQKS